MNLLLLKREYRLRLNFAADDGGLVLRSIDAET
jgi:hypothetical protein